MKDAIVLVESNTTTAELFITAAREEHLEPVMIVVDPGRYPFLEKFNIDVFHADTNDLNSIIVCIGLIKHKYNVRGIGSSSEYYIEIAARAAHYFNLPASDPESVKRCRDKYEQRKTLSSSGIKSPLFYKVTGIKQCEELSAKIKYPVVVKPAFGSGSIGVKMCDNTEQVTEHCGALLAQKTNERGMPLEPKVLVEEYIDGPEYSVETFNGNIVGITKKYVTDPPCFIETGHDFPCDTLDELTADEVKKIVLKALNVLGLNWGPVHTELKIVNGEAIIIEVNPRLAGGFIPSLIHLSKGIDLIKETIKQIAGGNVILNGDMNRYASIRFLIPQESGIFKNVENLSEIKKTEGVYEIRLYKEFGTELKINGDFRDRAGHIIYYGDDGVDVRTHIDRLIKQLKIVVN